MKSTVPVGTTHLVRDAIREVVGPNIPFSVADNPEFLKEGAAVRDFNYPDRVVLGVDDAQTGERLTELYEPFVRSGNPIMVMDVPSAEMVKYASNNFLATKISFINEMAALAEAYGADIELVRKGMSADERIGNKFLYPGLGYGGSCFPKDTRACIAMGQAKRVDTPLSQAVNDVNLMQRDRFFAKITSQFGSRPQWTQVRVLGHRFQAEHRRHSGSTRHHADGTLQSCRSHLRGVRSGGGRQLCRPASWIVRTCRRHVQHAGRGRCRGGLHRLG